MKLINRVQRPNPHCVKSNTTVSHDVIPSYFEHTIFKSVRYASEPRGVRFNIEFTFKMNSTVRSHYSAAVTHVSIIDPSIEETIFGIGNDNNDHQ